MARYSRTSPYYTTPQSATALGFFTPRPITAENDDEEYTIERT